jgi:predicted ATPase/DNA-binding CsgD family transcriptional regulator
MAPDDRAADAPVGTVTFLLADVDRPGSRDGDGPCGVIGTAVATHGGVPLDGSGAGEGMAAVFASASDAVAAALEVLRALATDPVPEERVVRVRMGIHTGEARSTGARAYRGMALHRAARLRDVAHGGQAVLSSVTASIVADALPAGSWLVDLGTHRLRDLSRPERVFELRHADLADEFPPLRSLDVLANNLPVQVTSFVGRRRELAVVDELVGRGRLVTLTGSGGCGKTRLAVQAAAGLADRWRDGVWWVDLGPVTDPARVAEVAAATIKVMVEPVGEPLRALTVQLRDRQLLVCLDNCEHLLDAGAELVDALLRSCPRVSVLATSREPLGVAGETVWRVPSMVEDEAMCLFGERANQARPGFAIDDLNRDAVRTVCQRLDGIPLAVELAAAWVRALTPAQITVGLDDRFRLLAGGPRGVTARQQTLAASVDWSYDLLDEPDRTLLRRLAVFAGGFTIDAASAACAAPGGQDVLVALGRLVDKSLVLVDEGEGQVHYRLLETIRQYAHDRLREAGEVAATRDRHLGFFLDLAEAAEPQLEDVDQDHWRAMLEAEHDNLRAALDWGLSSPDPERGRRLAAALTRVWMLHGHAHEGIGHVKRAIDLAPDDRTRLQGRLLLGAGQLAAAAGDFELMAEAVRQGLDVAAATGDARTRARCLTVQAYIHMYLDPANARRLCVDARRYAEADGDEPAVDVSLVLEALALTNCDRHEDARPILDAAVERCRSGGDRLLLAFALSGQLYRALLTGDLLEARRLGTEALGLARPLGDHFNASTSNYAWVIGVGGDIDAGLQLMEPVVRSAEAADHAAPAPSMAVTLGKLHLWRGDLDSARYWFERATRHGEPLVDNWFVARALPGLAAVHRRLGEPDVANEQLERATALAGKLDVPHALAEALDETAVLVAADDPDRAEDLHHQALAIRLRHGLRTSYVDSLDALARHAARAESFAEAVRLHAASEAGRKLLGCPRPPVDGPDHRAAVADLHSLLGAESFVSAWSEGAALTLDDAVAYARRARGSRARPSVGWASLTPTEIEVVGLTVDGLTNPEIAARLFMSRNTVKTHLSHVYAKLGVSNRTELAAAATARNTRR